MNSLDELETEQKACKAKMLRLISNRERCVSELRQRLSTEGYSSDVVEPILSWACECNLVNDLRFAEAYIAGKKSLGWGRERIEHELLSREIQPESLAGYPEAYFDEDEEYQRALQIASRIQTSAKNPHDAIYRRLLSKGFSPSLASHVATSLTS